MRFFSLIALFLFILATQASVACAQSKGTLTVAPAYVDVTLEKPEEEKEVEITYKNNSDRPIELEFFAIDFHQSDISGAIRFLEEKGSYSYSLVSFVEFDTNSLQLEPSEEKSIKVRLKNTFNLSPGGHYASIIARQVQSIVNDEQITRVAPGVSSLIYLRKVGGERFNLSITEIDRYNSPIIFSFPSRFNITFQNNGNVHLVPYGTVVLKDFLGRQIYQGSINEESIKVMPESRRYIKGYLTKSSFTLPVSINTLEITGSDSLKKTNFVHRNTFLYVNPVFAIGIFIGILFLAAVLVRKIIKRGK